MDTVIIIPARYASTRYPGKPLVELEDASGTRKSLIQRSWEAASAVNGVSAVYVATDDARIRAAAEGFGAKVIMTSEDCDNGTARCADAIARADLKPDLVVNLQGDSPLTPAWFVEDLIEAMAARPDAQMATPVLRCDAETYAHFREDRLAGRVGGTTAVFDTAHKALYFSKEVIPYIDPAKAATDYGAVYHHVGLYAYRPKALARYVTWPQGRLEGLEGLEQLRFLEHDVPVLCVEVEGRGRVFWELNNPEDVPRIERVLKSMT
ncbi:3-deoxy-manno-octulosonate cytidylyltransferase [Rhodalgimonas zhirmunskyi]|uniref:3-deoxy-manno-octulosonate cytidylyltransferase n=1 Tax=Rhodalgimonas zhirmunskyi TaxID=2964767 RepID=A0AAJ1X8K2_9RHOB|nr:manno-octulosonate cytidylyltransferase [Rhodoalgimonas zhirmunskyi]MDQ2095722.1 3-deoxy-manno-octulosonate cytidylyltransferase [Rhodoalgimonas zhirmunskyi]